MSTVPSRQTRPEPGILRDVPIFRDLDEGVLRRLSDIGELIASTDGTLLCRQGELADRLHVLIEGQVALSNMAPNGVSAVVDVVRPGGHFVLATVLARLPYILNAQAVAQSRLVVFAAADLLALLQDAPSLAAALMRAEAQDFRALVRQVCDLKLRTTAQRLGCYLLSLSKDPAGNSASLRLPFDKRLLAARLGCRQENLSRAFAALRGVGVETHGARVVLHDIARLKDYAEPDDFSEAEFA
ncbi:MAG: cyclic nucleotide-binding domain-containing protein [Acetobacteraceae bacterium]|nr:cyclic nucleotide-binding domain-containing protein [Acetobacteraceae bacterium]